MELTGERACVGGAIKTSGKNTDAPRAKCSESEFRVTYLVLLVGEKANYKIGGCGLSFFVWIFYRYVINPTNFLLLLVC